MFKNRFPPFLITWLAPAIALLSAVLLMHRRLVFSNLILARGDSYLYFYPYWHAAANALKAGRLPLWNPDLFMGAPLLANSQVGIFYPLNWPVWWLFDTPYAVSATIVLHVFIAALGMYWLGRRFQLTITGALTAALLYALGGYLTAQVEHVNQAQSLAWLPWILAVASNWEAAVGNKRLIARKIVAIALLFALQLVAGHTQTTFTTGIALCLWSAVQLLTGAWRYWREYRPRYRVYPPAPRIAPPPRALFATVAAVLGISVAISVLIAAVQLLPTIELTGLSRRQGGLPLDEALSFSLHPLLFARALLPGYTQINYSEYIASVPLIGLILGIFGIAQLRHNRRVWPPLVLLIVGILFGLGEFTPIYGEYIINLPAFDLFRAPARWMVLYAISIALLGGIGWDAIGRLASPTAARRTLAVALIFIVALIGLVAWSDQLAMSGNIPLPPENPAQTAVWQLWFGWMLELSVLIALLFFSSSRTKWLRYLLFVPMIVSLVYAGKTLQQSGLTSPDAFYDTRQAVARLQVSAEQARADNQPVPRFLSMSKGLFEPGDQGEIDSIYFDQLDERELYLYTTNAKDREIIVPNLTMIYGLSAVDGFDGGLLPTYDYAETVGLMLPPDVETVDGRLRELLTGFPDTRWLDLFGVKHIITDRIAEYVYTNADGIRVTFDVSQRVTLQPGESIRVPDLPRFQSSELWIAYEGTPGNVTVSAGAASDTWPVTDIGGNVGRAVWSEPGYPDGLTLTATDGDWTIVGVSVVNGLNNTHVQTVFGEYRTLHIGDVKVYENLDALPRAFMVSHWRYAEDVDGAIAGMSDPAFDPAVTAYVEGEGANRQRKNVAADATITAYTPERITISTRSEGSSLLVLTEAHYPTWSVTIDGEPAVLEKVDGMFRGVFVPNGEHEVVFQFDAPMLTIGAVVTAVGLLILFGLLVFGLRGGRQNTPQTQD